jgi:hypothetical protein
MPEATIHEYGNLLVWKNEIRLPKNRLIAPPPGDAVRSKHRHQG